MAGSLRWLFVPSIAAKTFDASGGWPASRSFSGGWCERRESNPDRRLRRPLHYPLCYARKSALTRATGFSQGRKTSRCFLGSWGAPRLPCLELNVGGVPSPRGSHSRRSRSLNLSRSRALGHSSKQEKENDSMRVHRASRGGGTPPTIGRANGGGLGITRPTIPLHRKSGHRCIEPAVTFGFPILNGLRYESIRRSSPRRLPSRLRRAWGGRGSSGESLQSSLRVRPPNRIQQSTPSLPIQ